VNLESLGINITAVQKTRTRELVLNVGKIVEVTGVASILQAVVEEVFGKNTKFKSAA